MVPELKAARPSMIRDTVAAILLVLGLLLPWNIHVGMRISGTPGWVFALLGVATLLAFAALLVSRTGTDPAGSARRAALLVLPYLMLVGAFTQLTAVIAIRAGGDGTVPPGVGPGAWAGLAGALLAAQSASATGEDSRRYDGACRVIGWVSVALAAVAALLTLYFRTRYVIPGIGGEATMPNLTTAVVAVLYSAAAVIPVLLVGRWIIGGDLASRLAVVALSVSTVVAGALVWVLPVGRQLDYFHGIAQRTGTSFVGYEGYLAWVAVAAIVGNTTLRAARHSPMLWRNAIRTSLMLIAVWCGCQAVLRVADIFLAGVLGMPALPYNNTVLMALDLIAAVLAAWLWINRGARTVPVTVLLFGVLFVLSVCRLVLGVALVPTVNPLDPGEINAVYGNNLSQQVTSTFDVTLSVLSLLLLFAAARFTDMSKAAPAISAPPADRVAEVLAQSSQRFSAGTTYGAPKPTAAEES